MAGSYGCGAAVSCPETMTEMSGEPGLPRVIMGYGVWALECLLIQKHEAFQPWMAERAKKENP
jgi:hypothetical protein